MATEKEKSSTRWTSADEAVLVQTLQIQKAEGNWGDNNPKPTAYTACETALAGGEKLSGGSAKNVQAIKSRWQRLKQEFDTVKQLRGVSGFRWDGDHKIVTAGADVWEKYLQTHAKAKPWCKKSFPLFDKISDLIDGSRATGTGAFRPISRTQSLVGSSATNANIDPALLALDDDAAPLQSSDDEKITLPGPSDKKTLKRNADVESDGTSGDDAEPAGPSRKRIKSHGKTGRDRHRSRTISAGNGLASVANSIETAMATLAGSISAVAGSGPMARPAAAISAIEKNEGLNATDFDDVVELMMSHPLVADMYLALQGEDSRKRFLQNQLEESRDRSA